MSIFTSKVCFIFLLSGVISNAIPAKNSNLVSASARKFNNPSAIVPTQLSDNDSNYDEDDKVYIPLIRDMDNESKTGWPLKNWKIEAEARPTFLSVVGSVFRNPTTIMAALAIPLFLIGSLIFPYIANMFASLNMLPQVTTTIASGVARSLDGRNDALSVDRVLDIINEYGARSLDDPKCLQRFLCQTVQFGLDGGQRNNSWSDHEMLDNIAKSVDEATLGTLGVKKVIKYAKSGKCNNLNCDGSRAYLANNLSVIDKVIFLGSKLYRSKDVFKKY